MGTDPIAPGAGGYGKVTVNNYGAQVQTSERSTGNGQRELIVMIDARVNRQLSDPYSSASPALAARGAKTPMKQR